MPVSSKLTKKKAKAKKSKLDKKKGLTTVIKPDGTRIDIPRVEPEKLSREDKFLLLWEEMLDEGIEIDEEDIPEDLLDTWYAFQDEIKPQVAKKNWMLWSAIFVPLILPAFVQGVSGKVELPPDAKVPSVAVPAPKPEKVSDYAKAYFQEHGLELCKTMSQTDLKNLKEQLIANWGKGEDFFKKSFQEDYVDSKARLDTIYRTEYAIAQNEGILARAKDAGHSFKVWNCALDERSCPVCSSMHGAIAPIDEVFPGTEWFRPQDSHPNCRCVMTTMKTEDINQEGIREDASYLNEVSNFIKLNYRCEFNGTDYKCDNLQPSTSQSTEILKVGSIINDIIKDKRQKLISEGKDPKWAKIEMRTYDSNLLGALVNERPSEEYKELAKQYGVKELTSLDTAWKLIHDISKGDQDAAREQVYEAFSKGGDIKKALELQIEVETQAFKDSPRTLYRKGGYHENTIESYTTNPKGANMTWMTNPENNIGTDFSKHAAEFEKDGWKVLTGVNTFSGYVGEDEVVLINMKDIESGNTKRSYDVNATLERIKNNRIEKELRNKEYKIRTVPIYENKIASEGDNAPKIPSNTVPMDHEKALDLINKFRQEKKPYYTNGISDRLAKEIGFDKPPVIVSNEQANKLVDEGGIELIERQSKSSSDQLKTADYFPNTVNGGYQFETNIEEIAKVTLDAKNNPGKYLINTGPDVVFTRAILDPNAKIINKEDLKEQSNKLVQDWQDKSKTLNDEMWKKLDGVPKEEFKEKFAELDKVYRERGNRYYESASKLDYPDVAAMVFGYDAIRDGNRINVINRGALYVQQEDIPISNAETFKDYYSEKGMIDSLKRWIEETERYQKDPKRKEESIKSYKESIEESKIKTIALRDKLYGKQKRNSSYLDDVANYIKLNTKCKAGTFDESNKCGPGKESNNANNINIFPIKDIGLSIKMPNIKTVRSISGKLFGSEDSMEAVAAYDKSTNTILVRDIDWNEYIKLADKKEPGPISHTKENTIYHELSHIVAPTDIMKVKYINPDQQKAWQNFFIENGGSIGVSKLIGKYGAENLSETIPEALTIYLGNKEKTNDKIIKFLKEANIIKDSNNNFQEVSSSFNPELGGFHTTDYKTTNDKPLRVISQDKADNPKLLDAIKDIDQAQLPSQFMVMKMKDNVPAKYYKKLDAIGVDKTLEATEMAKAIKDILKELPKNNSRLLDEVASFIKLNYGTSEGARKAWDTRGRGHKEELKETKPTKFDLKSSNTYKKFSEKLAKGETPEFGNPNTNEDLLLHSIATEIKFDSLPKVIPANEISNEIRNGGIELFRGVSQPEYTESLKYGPYFAGTGLYGNGMYTAIGKNGYNLAVGYAGQQDNCLNRMVLRKDSKIISGTDVRNKMVEELSNFDISNDKLLYCIISDPGRWAMINGYDAIRYDDLGMIVVLNREKLMVQKEHIKQTDYDTIYKMGMKEFSIKNLTEQKTRISKKLQDDTLPKDQLQYFKKEDDIITQDINTLSNEITQLEKELNW